MAFLVGLGLLLPSVARQHTILDVIKHPRPQAQAREALTVALVQAVELLDCDWFFCPKGMLRVGTKCGLTLNNGWREE